jgi:hypothetical protein
MKKLLLICCILLGSIAGQAQDENIRFTSYNVTELSTFNLETSKYDFNSNTEGAVVSVVNLTDSVLMIQVKRKGFFTEVYGYDILRIIYGDDANTIIAFNKDDEIELHINRKIIMLYYNWNNELKAFLNRCVYFNKEDYE